MERGPLLQLPFSRCPELSLSERHHAQVSVEEAIVIRRRIQSSDPTKEVRHALHVAHLPRVPPERHAERCVSCAVRRQMFKKELQNAIHLNDEIRSAGRLMI